MHSKYLTEDQVIDAVRRFLKRNGWEIVGRASAKEQGIDLVAKCDGKYLLVEAKGAGSSKPNSSRYGQEFDGGQVFDHVAKAILKALQVVGCGNKAGVAFPDNENHRKEVAKVHQALQKLGIAVFWVSADETVEVDWAMR